MGDRHNRQFVISMQFGKKPDKVTGGSRVQIASRFIAQKNPRPVEQRPREGHPLSFTTRKSRRGTVTGTFEPDFRQQFISPVSNRLCAPPLLTARKERSQRHVVPTTQMIEQVVALENESDRAAPVGADFDIVQGSDFTPVDLHRSNKITIETTDQVEKGRLARTRTPDDRHEVAVSDLQIDFS